MEVKEEETKICRLCGQSDNICIDVFSEDGTSRLLRIKIHSKINILIEEDDELPTSVCVKCIGALEFLCDFYDWCHRIQQNFQQKVKRNHNSTSDESVFSTDESDKENVFPAKSAKRKLKTKVSSTDVSKKVTGQEEFSDSENPELSSVNKECSSVTISSAKELHSSSGKETPVSPEKEVPISSEKETEVTFTSLKQVPYAFGKEISVSVCKEASPLAKSCQVQTEKALSVSIEKVSTSVSVSASPNKEISIENNNSVTSESRLNVDKNQKDQKRKSAVSPLAAWLKGEPMNKKRKRNASPVQGQVEISRLSESKYSKISELMTKEQKQAIENYYRVDMSVVDEIKVADNMKIYSRNEIECKICKKKYNRMDKCQVHIWRHLDMTPYFCDACDFTTLTVSNIRCHIRKSHLKIKPYSCHLCEKRYTSPTSLEEHLNTHTGAKPYQCTLCNFSSASKQVLSYHTLTHKKHKDVECDVCGKTFYSKGRLRTHKFIHNKDTAFKCKYCSTYFMQKEALDKHYTTAHAQDYVCNICNKNYKSKKALNNHQNVHSEAKYQCTMCPNRYKSHHILKEHILKHGGIRKYKCQICQKTFAQQSHLAAHMSVHIGIRYECPGCKKGFNRHDNMKVHTKRCNDFLSNPALKEVLLNKTKTKTESISSADTATDAMSVSSMGSINSAKTSALSAKKPTTKVEIQVDSENSDEESDSESMFLYLEDVNSNQTGNRLSNCIISDDDDVISREEICVTENILSPECF